MQGKGCKDYNQYPFFPRICEFIFPRLLDVIFEKHHGLDLAALLGSRIFRILYYLLGASCGRNQPSLTSLEAISFSQTARYDLRHFVTICVP